MCRPAARRAVARRATAALSGLAALSAGPAAAHGLGNRYALSLPGWLFISGGAGVVVVSFAIVSAFADRTSADSYRSVALSETPLRVLTRSGVVRAARVAAVGLLAVALVAGYSLLKWGGMVQYGKDAWLDRADLLTRLYTTLSLWILTRPVVQAGTA